MKDIFISYAKEDKKTARRLVTKLESERELLCWISPRDANTHADVAEAEKEGINNVRMFVLLLSKNAEKSSEVKRQLNLALDSGIPVVPFKTDSMPESLSLSYMLHELEWVDAHGDGFETAFDILLEIYDEYLQGKPTAKKTSKPTGSGSEGTGRQGKYVLGAAAAVLLLILAYYFLGSDNGAKSNTADVVNNTVNPANGNLNRNSVSLPLEKYTAPEGAPAIVGSWRVIDYQDSRQMSVEERRLTEQNIDALKKNALVVFKADGTFLRSGFAAQNQSGKWEYDDKELIVSLTPNGSDRAEQINLLKAPDSTFTIVVNEKASTPEGGLEDVTTRITFKKQQ